MMADAEISPFALAAFAAISFLLLWRWKAKKLGRKQDEFRRNAYERLASYHSRSDHPKYEFSGKDAAVVLRKKEFVPRSGQLYGTFIFLCRNAFGEYFFA